MTTVRPTARPLRVDGLALAELVSSLLQGGASVRLTAHGGSMSPWIRDGDAVTLAPLAIASRDALRPGSVVAFRHPRSDRLIVHRLVRRQANGWLARGDRCDAVDGYVRDDAVLARVVRITRGDRWLPLPQGRVGILLAMASRFALQLRDRIRPPPTPGTAGATEDRP